jgi:curved DNA-binding protein CbpA
MGNPFETLGLPVSPDLGDDDIRAAWRRIAAATHPDREDGGDPARYAEAADAYARLRTSWDRSELYADLPPPAARPGRSAARPGRSAAWPGRSAARPGHVVARPVVLAARVACATAVGYGAYAAAGWVPATPAVITGALTWLVLTGRRDLR